MSRRLLTITLCVTLAACSDDSTNITFDTIGRTDSGTLDLPTTPDRGGDTLAPDSARPDSTPTDTRPAPDSAPIDRGVDTRAPDGGGSPDGPRADGPAADGPAADGPAVPDALLLDGPPVGDFLLPDAGPALSCAAVIGKPCTDNGGECGSSAAVTCLLTDGTRGVCTCACTPDDPQTPLVNEDSCPNQAQNRCGTLQLTGGTTASFCLRECNPQLGTNGCTAPLACDPRSGAQVGLFDGAVCLFPGCTTNADCPVLTSTSCATSGGTPCPTGETCVPLVAGGTQGLCARDGLCDTASGLCGVRTSNFKATASVGDPCKDDTECGATMRCEREVALKAGGQACADGAECCSGTCAAGLCTAGQCPVHARNGYCYIANCAFPTLPQFACPSGSSCNQLFSGGLCQKSCTLGSAASCRGVAVDKLGDYECRSWNNIAIGGTSVSPTPVCDFGDTVTCDTFTFLGCDVFGDLSNTTNFRCRNTQNQVLTNPKDPSGLCLDDTASGPVGP
jgi:hypothetical protein